MENGSTPPSAGTGEADQNGHLPLSARLLGVGVRGVRSVGKATGVDRAVEVAAEEAIVAAVESEAVERAMARVLQGPIVEDAVQGALESDTVKKALLEAMDSDLVDEVWRRLLASEEVQQLVERIAEAPEVRAAISAQGAGLLEDIGRTIGKLTRRLDDSFERAARRIFFRRRRVVASTHAGAVSRALAMVIDGVFVNLSFTAIVAVATLVDNAFGGGGGASSFAIAVGSTAWLALGSLYLVGFWSLVGQTPGMRFVRIRLSEPRLPFGRSEAPGRAWPLGDRLRHRLPRHRLRRAAPRLGGPLRRHRGRLRRAAPRAGAMVAAGASAGTQETSLRTLKAFVPRGVSTLTVAPTLEFIRALPIGDSAERRPSARFASVEPTRVQTFALPLASSTTSALRPKAKESATLGSTSTTTAFFSRSCSRLIRVSRWA